MSEENGHAGADETQASGPEPVTGTGEAEQAALEAATPPAAEEKIDLTYEEAVAMLNPDGRIHTFRSTPMALLGADADREDILQMLRDNGPQLSGPQAANMHHGLVVFDDHGPLFIETRQDDEALRENGGQVGSGQSVQADE
jgi:hypothetical protein